ncbi:hypothetical protein ACHHYP_10139 [Achlya hypogyna]|uniref:PARP-type domain-containing protein n=1 Tax=Achlya hypogyna TaxID=1202772 RepID=A0A1V9ZI82_ACHHY|nr:hypothetical protein ACHHYP_10139 [Achlya hypogyna]
MYMQYDVPTPSSSDVSWSRNSTVLVCPPASRHPTCRTCHKRYCFPRVALGRALTTIDTVRIGIIYTHMDGYILMRWYHIGCVAPPNDLMAHDIEGLSERAMRPYRAAIFDWLGRKPCIERLLCPSGHLGINPLHDDPFSSPTYTKRGTFSQLSYPPASSFSPLSYCESPRTLLP